MTIPSLAEVVATHRWHRTLADPRRVRCTAPGCGWSADLTTTGKSSTVLVGEHVEQVWAEVRTIRTVEQLEMLPDWSVIRVRPGLLYEAAEKSSRQWWAPGLEHAVDPAALVPALLIHHPDWSRP